MSIRKGRLTSTGVLAAPVNFPTGSVLDFAGSTAPDGWLLCFGQAVSRTDYAGLFATLGTTYGVGDGSTTFNLPDYRGRVLVGKDDMGGVAASRMTTAGSGVNGLTLGSAGGAQTHALTIAQLANHNHTQNVHGHASRHADDTQGNGNGGLMTGNEVSVADFPAHTGVPSSTQGDQIGGTTATNIANGSGSAHQNTQPSIIANKIIKV